MRLAAPISFALPDPESELLIVAERLPRIRGHFQKNLPDAVWPRAVLFQELCDRYNGATTGMRAEDRQRLREIIESEYDAAFFRETLVQGREIQPEVERAVRRLDQLAAPSREHFRPPIWLSRYGGGGGFSPSRKSAFVTAVNPVPPGFGERLRGVAVHEVVHLYLEPLVKAYRLQHWEKEAFVDLLTKRLFGEFGWNYEMQDSDSVSPMEEVFKAFTEAAPEAILVEYRLRYPSA